MTVFTWTGKSSDPNDADSDEFNTFWFAPVASCLLCGEPMQHGQKVMAWRAHGDLVLHAECVKDNARGLMKDIAECLQ